MHGACNTCWNAHHALYKKCICARACAHMQRCRSFFAMEAIANLSWVLREHRAGCRLPPALATPPAVSTNPVARRCSLKKSVQIHASSWRGRSCGVAQALFNHPRWCRPHPVCPWVALALGHGVYPLQKCIFAIFSHEFFPIQVQALCKVTGEHTIQQNTEVKNIINKDSRLAPKRMPLGVRLVVNTHDMGGRFVQDTQSSAFFTDSSLLIICIYIHIDMCREREGEWYMYMYICIYTYI